MDPKTARRIAKSISGLVALERALATVDSETPDGQVVELADLYISQFEHLKSDLARARHEILASAGLRGPLLEEGDDRG
jgi:hypothetical protein